MESTLNDTYLNNEKKSNELSKHIKLIDSPIYDNV